MPDTSSADFERLLTYLKATRGFDFTGYKRPSLRRRIDKRMKAVGIQDHAAYIDHLEVHPEEFERLFNMVLINVTGFFRDPPAWELVRRQVLPALMARKGADEPIRVWSAGCASGEEAYTAAILFAEEMGVEAFRRRVKIYATDVDAEALDEARHAVYSEEQLENLPEDSRQRYFENHNKPLAFRGDLRRSVIFGRHDLVQDAPIGRIDLLLCRNTLMYFNAETQAQILGRLHSAVNDGGFLLLGKVEMILSHAKLFAPLDSKVRLFRKVADDRAGDRLRAVGPGAQAPDSDDGRDRAPAAQAFEASRTPQVVVDGAGRLCLANERARSLFGISSGDLDQPFQDTALSYRPVELRSAIDQARSGRHPVRINDVGWQLGDRKICLSVEVAPLGDGGPQAAVLVTFFDVTRDQELERELQSANEELETAYGELQSTNEELETTNEELQSTVEELETTNEELQSTNEELETINEELQATNDELHGINDELRQRSADLDEANAFLESILGSLQGGVVVLDNDFRVQIWSEEVADLWGLRPDEVDGAAFLTLDIGLPVGQLAGPIRAAMQSGEGKAGITVRATDRRGKLVDCRVSCTPLLSKEGRRRGVIMLVDADR